MRQSLLMIAALAASMVMAVEAHAQFPQTDIYYIRLVTFGNTGARADTVINVTRRAGYDNQPSVSPAYPNNCWYSSIREDGQADVYKLDLSRWPTVSSERVTSTSEAEYSPRVMQDGEHLTVVRVEADSSQRLVQMDPDGANPTRLLSNIPDLGLIGYYAGLDDKRLLLFILGEPHALWMVDVTTGTRKKLADDIGRCFRPMPWVGPDAIAYVQKDSTGSQLCELDVTTGKRRTLMPMPDRTVEDFEWVDVSARGPTRLVLTAFDGRILFATLGESDAWKTWIDLTPYRLTALARLAWRPGADFGLFVVAADTLAAPK
ncbi:MAG TPA: hypothetical protein VF720_04305 [Candidatus Eisenbacteria bacterium]